MTSISRDLPRSTRSLVARFGSPERGIVSSSDGPSATRPLNTMQRTPAAAQRRATSPGAFPRSVVRSTVPSPVTTRSYPVASNPTRSRTSGAPGNSSAPSEARAAPRPPAAPAPGTSAYGASAGIAASRASSSAASADEAPFCAENSRAASTRGTSTSQATRVGAGSSPSTASRPAPPSTLAVPPRHTSSSRGCPTARMTSARPRLEAANGSSRSSSSGIASAASTTLTPLGSSSQRATRGRPNASATSTSRHSPPSAACSTSSVPSPPSATGSWSTSAHERNPSASAAAASRADSTPLRLAGHASARAFCIRDRLLLRGLCLRRVRHHPEHRDGKAFARKEDQADADPDGRLDGLEAERERDPTRLVHAVVREERQRDRRLHEPDIPGPQREDRRDVHQHEHEASGREGLVDPERAHRRVDGQQLTRPAEQLKEQRERGGRGPAHDAEPVTREPHHLAHRTETVFDPRITVVAGTQHREGEEDDAEDNDRDQTRDGPARNVCGQGHVHDQDDDGDQIEDAVREHRAEQARPGAALRHAPVEYRNPCELADPSRQNGVREQSDGEGGEDEQEARVRSFERIHDHRAPGERTNQDREQVEPDGCGDPRPLDRLERIGHSGPGRPAPPECGNHAGGGGEDERGADPAAAQEPHDASACS